MFMDKEVIMARKTKGKENQHLHEEKNKRKIRKL